MLLQELLNRRINPMAVFKPVDPETVTITDEELQAITEAFLRKKIASINSENYRKAITAEVDWKIPTYLELYESLLFELQNKMKWVIDEYNEWPIKKLAAYFSGDEGFELMEDNYDLKKGLALFGPVGCGKTTLLRMLARNPYNPFRVVSCRKVAGEYAEFGHSALSGYSVMQTVTRDEWFNHRVIASCFDDLGTESEKRNFGNQVNVMAEIILNRYDNIETKNHTMITTNLSTDDMLDFYGERAVSRMRELFNVIEFPTNSPDRRK